MRLLGILGVALAVAVAFDYLVRPGGGILAFCVLLVAAIPLWLAWKIGDHYSNPRCSMTPVDDEDETDDYAGSRQVFDHNSITSSSDESDSSRWDEPAASFEGDDPHGSDINPATGLPMMGATDIAGNPYGTDLSHDHWDDSLHRSHEDWSRWDD